MEDRLPRLYVFPHKAGDSGAHLVEFEALDDPGVGHTIEGLLVVDSGRREITALGSHLLKDGFVDEELVFAAITQGHPASIFGKYLFGRRFEIWNFRNIFCKISCLPSSPRIFEHLKNGIIAHFN